MKKITRGKIEEAIRQGFSMEEARRGYTISVGGYGNSAEHIEKIDCMNVFSSDAEAGYKAIEDGVRIIRDIQYRSEDFAFYIDTPHNRKLLAKLGYKRIGR